MKDKPIKTAVCFRREDNGDILALMPEIPHTLSPNTMACYASIGHHSWACMDYVRDSTKPATEAEYRPLLRELENIGYTVRVIRRIGPKYLKIREAELRRVEGRHPCGS
jgi:hypothetical protein